MQLLDEQRKFQQSMAEEERRWRDKQAELDRQWRERQESVAHDRHKEITKIARQQNNVAFWILGLWVIAAMLVAPVIEGCVQTRLTKGRVAEPCTNTE